MRDRVRRERKKEWERKREIIGKERWESSEREAGDKHNRGEGKAGEGKRIRRREELENGESEEAKRRCG